MTIHAPQVETPQTPTEPMRMNWADFLVWADGNTHVEWINGEVTEPVTNTPNHQQIMKFLLRFFDTYLDERPIGRVYPPIMMRLPEKPSGREPDVAFLLNEHIGRVKDTYVDGPVDIAVEIVSKDSEERDRGDKFFEYEAGGVTEYWLIDPLREEAALYALGDDKRYRRLEPDADGYLRSTVVPGLYVLPSWFWQIDDLDVKAILKESERWVKTAGQ